jgi:hypothetical protein
LSTSPSVSSLGLGGGATGSTSNSTATHYRRGIAVIHTYTHYYTIIISTIALFYM